MYGQIISFLFVLLILYYVVMILLDLQKMKAAKAAELEKNSEEDIDISDEANTFQPIIISRDEPQKAQATEAQTTEKTGESTGQSESKDYHQSDTTESDKDKRESPVDKPEPKTPNGGSVTSEPPSSKPDPELKDKPDEVKRAPNTFKREGYREPTMTDGVPIEQLIDQVDEYAESGKGPLGEVIFECRSAQL